MADLSAINALSSLNERDLYYQYLINNNSKSTMFNALSGNTSDSSNGLSMSNIMSAVTSGYSTSGITSLLGSSLGISDNGDISSLGAISSFSSILQLYLNNQTSEAAAMADKLADALEEAEEAGETSTVSYKTVQEIYEYFAGKTSSAAQALMSKSTSASQTNNVQAAAFSSSYDDFDFDSFESNIEESINSAMATAGINLF